MTDTQKIPPAGASHPRAFHSGKELRDRSWELIYAADLDYAPKHIALKDEFNGRAAPIDGLIRTAHGYYRLAEDTRDGTRVLLHSYERDQLTGIGRQGQIMLDGNATDVYGVSARKSARGALFRYDMERDMWYLGRVFQKDLNLHAEELSIPSKTPGLPPRRKIKLANGHVAFGIIETDDGKWRIRFYSNLRRAWDETSSFTPTATEKNGAARLFTPSRMVRGKDGSLKEFEKLEDAIDFVRRYWKSESRRLFKGMVPLEEKGLNPFERLRNGTLSWMLRVRDQKIFRSWARGLTITATVGLVTTALTGAPLVGVIMAAGSAVGWSIFDKSIESIVENVQHWLLDKIDRQKMEAQKPQEERDYINEYVLDTEMNQRRYRKKLSDDSYRHLRLLNIEEADMMYDDAEPIPPVTPLRDYERLTSAAFRYFGAQFDSSNGDDGILVAIYPNGLVSLAHVAKGVRETKHYIAYNRKFDLFGDREAYKHLDPKLTNLPGKGEVHKITHKRGKDFGYVAMSGEEFIADLSHKIGKNAQDIKAFGLPVTKLFNLSAAEEVVPRRKETIPVRLWMTGLLSPEFATI